MKPSSGNSAAMIAAIATLITALLGVVVFLVGQFGPGARDGSGTSGGSGTADAGRPPPDGAGAGTAAAPPRELDATVAWQDELLLRELSSVDWDKVPPLRDGGGLDVTDDTYVWPAAEISSPWTMARWEDSRTPGVNDCATRIATRGVSDRHRLDIGARFCLRTNEGRTVFLSVRERANGWTVDATIWQVRT